MGSSDQAVLCRYSYDPLDRLASSSPTDQADIQRFYQKNRLATEIQGALRRTVFQHEDLLLAQQRRVDGAVDTTLLATDQQRSVLQLVGKAGVESIAYSPYGHHPAESGLSSLLGFNGERRDPVTGHYLLGNGYRAYNPVLMRFNSPDSLSPFGEGGLNAYGYVGGDPVGFGDETGRAPGRLVPKKKRGLNTVDSTPETMSTSDSAMQLPSNSEAPSSSGARISASLQSPVLLSSASPTKAMASATMPLPRKSKVAEDLMANPVEAIVRKMSDDTYRKSLKDWREKRVSTELLSKFFSSRRKLNVHKLKVKASEAAVQFDTQKLLSSPDDAFYKATLIRSEYLLKEHQAAKGIYEVNYQKRFRAQITRFRDLT